MIQPIYETAQLYLLPSDPCLAAKAADYYRRNRDFFAPFDPVRDDDFFTESFQRESLTEDCNRVGAMTGYRFWLEEKGGDSVIGTVALNSIVWGSFRSCFLGYKLDRERLNRGYMTQAVKKCAEIAFHDIGLHRIEANIMPWNKASLRVAEKAGFVYEGLSKEYLNINGVWEDHVHMVLLNSRESSCES